MTLIDKINRVEYLLKHMPGRHDQQRHDPHKGVASEGYIASGDRQREYKIVGEYDTFKDMKDALWNDVSDKDRPHIETKHPETPGAGKYYLYDLRQSKSLLDPRWEEQLDANWKPKTVFHATSREAVESIQKDGLRATATAAEGPSVYFTTDYQLALDYGEAHAPNFAVVEFKVPRYSHADVVFDDHDFQKYGIEDSFYIPQDVPANWISDIQVFGESGRGGYKRIKEDAIKGYAVVILDG